jgi:hypothetical protein
MNISFYIQVIVTLSINFLLQILSLITFFNEEFLIISILFIFEYLVCTTLVANFILKLDSYFTAYIKRY